MNTQKQQFRKALDESFKAAGIPASELFRQQMIPAAREALAKAMKKSPTLFHTQFVADQMPVKRTLKFIFDIKTEYV